MVAGSDLDLLRAYEPVLRFTRGELFLPTAVGRYVEASSLWSFSPEGDSECLVVPGQLDLPRLQRESVEHGDRPLSLRLVAKPLNRLEYWRWHREPRERLDASARFTTTGMFGRLVDAGFRGSLLLRGKVAAGLAAAAEITYRELLDSGRCTYYGRVVRDGGFVCLQYWYFYAMNDWRSTFGGVNDHEADWEMVTVYVTEQDDGELRPAWVASSSHDYHGDDLRRRWDDPALDREGEHPVIYAGAGSHSGAFVPGDYVVSVDPPQLRWVVAAIRRAQRFLAPWRNAGGGSGGFGIPYVDYARGDGAVVGVGGDEGWTAELIDDETPWVRDYRGLWGLDTEDRFGGERAPAGPRYERDGSVRMSWADPLAWAGLLKIAPDEQTGELLAERIGELDEELRTLDGTITEERGDLRGLVAQTRSLDAHDSARGLAAARWAEVDSQEARLNEAIAERTRLREERRIHLDTMSLPLEPLAPQAHLRRVHGPRVEEQTRRTRLLRIWSALSTPLILVALIVVINGPPVAFLSTIVLLAAAFIGAEAFARRRFVSFLASAALLFLAISAAVALAETLRDDWLTLISLLLAAAALGLLIGNIRDLRHGWRRGPTPEPEDAA